MFHPGTRLSACPFICLAASAPGILNHALLLSCRSRLSRARQPCVRAGASPATALAPESPRNKGWARRSGDNMNGFCADPPRIGSACKTVITRAQFEKLTEALQPGMSPSLRLNVANAYARNLRMSAAAEKRGLDKTPDVRRGDALRAHATAFSGPGPRPAGGGQQYHRRRSRRLLQEERSPPSSKPRWRGFLFLAQSNPHTKAVATADTQSKTPADQVAASMKTP